ncbi:hypothetical protein RvY_18099 [Ramazzottius varieornatus]|uniref:Guanylate cyclase domain-containing protein n=1 Tax=Ramazzottius varieornatus TaxID=947166 RepID=A0A1D1W561_RAMVA|nr:hypothetical protein RvY_18099 [Ramazzottius varieornatus]
MKIQITEATRNILQFFSSFELVLRGVVPVKGKGEMTTFWLEGLKSDNPSDAASYPFPPPATATPPLTSMDI